MRFNLLSLEPIPAIGGLPLLIVSVCDVKGDTALVSQLIDIRLEQ